MRLLIGDQQQPRFYLAMYSHNTSLTDRQTNGRTNGRTTTIKDGRVKTAQCGVYT